MLELIYFLKQKTFNTKGFSLSEILKQLTVSNSWMDTSKFAASHLKKNMQFVFSFLAPCKCMAYYDEQLNFKTAIYLGCSKQMVGLIIILKILYEVFYCMLLYIK